MSKLTIMHERLRTTTRPRVRTLFSRALLSLAAPLAIALPPVWFCFEATRRATLTMFGRDQGIFQYVAWAITRGEVDYRDVRDVNGPLTHLVHWVFLKLGGADETRFRQLDLALTAIAFAWVGAMLPGVVRAGRRGAVPTLERAGWALAAWVVLGAQYLGYGFWDLAQRESFFDWFLFPSIALQMLAQARARAWSARRFDVAIAAAGALSLIPWFGKPTYGLFTVVQIVSLLIDRDLPLPWKARLARFAIGGVAGALVPLGFLFATGDTGAYLHIALVDVPAMYRFIWPRAAWDVFSVPLYATWLWQSIAGGVAILALVAFGQMHRRVLPLALVPACGLVSVLAQGKAFPYHFHPVSAGIALQWLALALWAWEAWRGLPASRIGVRARRALVAAPLAACVCLALYVANGLESSPNMKASWLLSRGATPEQRVSKDYFDGFAEPDFFQWDMRQAAAWLRIHTAPDDRVQTYGMDPYILFLAERRSATPYIYDYDLDVDAALAGGTGGVPDDAQRARIRAIRDAHESDLLERLDRSPPVAFVFQDKGPLIPYADAHEDFVVHCPRASAWFERRYEERETFGTVHVWMRIASAP